MLVPNTMLYRVSCFMAWCLWKVFFRLQVSGQGNIPRDGGGLIVANHTSFLDPLLICAVMPRVVHYITYSFFYDHPAIHWYCKRVCCIPVRKAGNDIAALKHTFRLLKQGELIGIFPEGRRSETGRLVTGEPGVGLIALKANVPIVPIGIAGAYQAFPKGAKWPKPTAITLTIGKPFLLNQDADRFHIMSAEDTHQAATDLIMTKIAELCEQTGDRRPPQDVLEAKKFQSEDFIL